MKLQNEMKTLNYWTLPLNMHVVRIGPSLADKNISTSDATLTSSKHLCHQINLISNIKTHRGER